MKQLLAILALLFSFAGFSNTESVARVESLVKGKMALHSACDYNFQCQSGNCIRNQCSDGSARSACEYNFQCQGGMNCIDGRCSDGGSRSACEYNFQCQGGMNCIDGRCSDGSNNAACEYTFQCKGGMNCIKGRCSDGSSTPQRPDRDDHPRGSAEWCRTRPSHRLCN